MKKKGYNYFEALARLAGYSSQSAENLHRILKNFDPQKLQEMMDQMHKIEHTADIEHHQMLEHLSKEFITPLEREDIINLAQEIDEVTDSIEDVLIKIYMFNITEIRVEALAMAEVIKDCAHALGDALSELHNFKKSEAIYENIIEINRLEEVGDELYTKAVCNLYRNCAEPLKVVAWTETFFRMEKCCDYCEHAADVMESIIMKNS